ncbi:MAG: tyrosine-type recombinase/integrase [Oscillospiraceae bacterium]
MPRKTLQKNLSYDTQRKRYYAIFCDGVDENGKRVRHTQTFTSYQEAVTALHAANPTEETPPAASYTVEGWLNYWLEGVIARQRAVSTIYGYRNIMRCHLIPALGGLPLDELSPMRLQAYVDDKVRGGLSPNTVRKHYILLTAALRYAVRLDVLERNPMERVDAPVKVPQEYSFYSPIQLQRLFAAAAGTVLELPVKLAAYLGLRRSEICGLRWGNVDLQNWVITICDARTEVGSLVVDKDPKTATSHRRLGIAGLRDLQKMLLAAQALRPGEDDRDYVILRQDGLPLFPHELTDGLPALARKYQLPHITMHGLRHSFASVANSQGVQMYAISKTLGHSSIGVTSGIYTHLFDDTQQMTISVVGQAIESAGQTPQQTSV